VVFNGKRYPTSEHLFQSFKVCLFCTSRLLVTKRDVQFQENRPNLAEHIRTCSERPSVAFSQARRFQPEVRSDWMKVNIQKVCSTHAAISRSPNVFCRWMRHFGTSSRSMLT
jgi:diaminohydroxyphosphoribosylaminopyrimidine deaminase/5-amino-6-(5-phosphoribosylamino)uracil reductase